MQSFKLSDGQNLAGLNKSRGMGLVPLVVISLVFHLLLFGAFALGWQDEQASQPKKIMPKYVQAKLVQLKAKTKPKKFIIKNKVIDLSKKKREQALKKASDLANKKKLAQQKADKIKADKAQAKKDQAHKDELARQKSERLKAETALAAKQKAEQEAAELAQQEATQQQLAADLAAEEATLNEQAEAEQDQIFVQSHTAIIKQKIASNWSRPPSARKGMQCLLAIQLVPTGRVIAVTVVESSGSAAFDRSAEQAVKKAEQFPDLRKLPPQVFERNFRTFKLRFNPKDLRL